MAPKPSQLSRKNNSISLNIYFPTAVSGRGPWASNQRSTRKVAMEVCSYVPHDDWLSKRPCGPLCRLSILASFYHSCGVVVLVVPGRIYTRMLLCSDSQRERLSRSFARWPNFGLRKIAANPVIQRWRPRYTCLPNVPTYRWFLNMYMPKLRRTRIMTGPSS